jgi:hypothetical protein
MFSEWCVDVPWDKCQDLGYGNAPVGETVNSYRKTRDGADLPAQRVLGPHRVGHLVEQHLAAR